MKYLEWSDVDFRKNVIHIRPKEITDTRRVRLSDNIFRELGKKLKGREPDEPVFKSESEVDRFPYVLPIRRKSDLMSLCVRDIDADRQEITMVRRFPWRPKASSGSVPISPGLREVLEKLKEEATSNFVFPNLDGGHWRIDIRNELIRIAEMAGIENFTRVHDLRHTTGAQLRAHGIALETIMGVLRHADIRETLVYAPYHEDEGQEAVKKLDFF